MEPSIALTGKEDIMGFLTRMPLSRNKGAKLHRLEIAIAPPHERVSRIVADLMCAREQDGPTEKKRALEEFLDLCESDEGVRRVMEREHLSRVDLRGIAVYLMVRGLAEWVKGHCVALSTIAHVEPLLYFILAERHGVDQQHIFAHLLQYWEGKISSRELLDHLPAASSPDAPASDLPHAVLHVC